MKRKVIQIADSTQLISLPRKWCLANSIHKGDELEVEGIGDKLTVSCKPEIKIEKAELHMKEYGILAPRVIYSLYKKGIDEVKIYFNSPEDVQLVQKALKNETVGYEIVEQDSQSCLIKNISSNIMAFDTMLRRTFLLLTSFAEETAHALSKKEFASLKNLLGLEESNNRFTTLCRRYLNKYGSQGNTKIGPLYAMIEELEKIADEYKYLIVSLGNLKNIDAKINPQILGAYQTLLKMLQETYHSFYKMEPEKVANIAATRKQMVAEWTSLLHQIKNPTEFVLMHHALVLMQKTFNLVGPMIILNIHNSEQSP